MDTYRLALAIVALTCGDDALAQSTSTTMDMGGGMTHVDTMGPNGAMSSSNCMNMGGGMATCNTMDMSQPQRTYPMPDISRPSVGGSNTMRMIADLIARSNERSFQKKIGKLVAKGDCPGAAKLALNKGRLELVNQINSACLSNNGANVTRLETGKGTVGASEKDQIANPLPLEELVRNNIAKENAALPIALDGVTTISKA